MAVRAGLTVPLPGALHTHGPTLARLADAGFSDAWSGEADAFDAFTPLALAATWEPRLRVGTAVVPAYTRGPPTIAQSAAALVVTRVSFVAVGWVVCPFEGFGPVVVVGDVVEDGSGEVAGVVELGGVE